MLRMLRMSKTFTLPAGRQPHTIPEGSGAWLILEDQRNPSTDYYVKPELERLGYTHISADLKSRPPSSPPTNKIVVTRYLNEEWARWIQAHADTIKEFVYFMDDELLRPETWKSLPMDYQKKLNANFQIVKRWLPKLKPHFWVSTETLRVANPVLLAQVVHPKPLPGDQALSRRQPDPSRRHLILYHATASHYNEFLWLKPILEQILSRNAKASFEVIGNGDTNRLFRSLPRTRVLYPMSWENYLAYSSSVAGGLALAPLLDNPFNYARSSVKSIDIARMNAYGLFSANSGYINKQLPNGMCLPNIQSQWVETIENWLESQ